MGAGVLLALTGSVFAVRGTVEAAIAGLAAVAVALGSLLALTWIRGALLSRRRQRPSPREG